MDTERIEQIAFNEGYRRGYEQGKADAVSVVRCKECKHWNMVSNGCMRNPSVEGWQAGDYCSYGERKESE